MGLFQQWESGESADDGDVPLRFSRTMRWRLVPAFLELLCAGGMLVGAWLMLSGLIASAHFFGQTPTAAHQHRTTMDFRAAAFVVLACSTLGTALTWRRRSAVVRVLWRGMGALSLVGLVLMFSAPTAKPTQSPSHCQEYSGDATNCPGG